MIKNKNYNTFFYYWLLSLIILISIMIIVGGLTRLTDSGLSITQWELFSGIIPPLSSEAWDYYFELYKEIPQFIFIKNSISLNEFKIIYMWEYFHRLLGRLIGLFFLIPFIYFLLKKTLTKNLKIKLFIIFLIILLQGAIGWYMVKSGLVENVSVSHFRLSLHLVTAFILLSSLIWLFMNFIKKSDKLFFNLNASYITIKLILLLIFIQIIIGAFVSGLDAGRIYQTWPLMNNTYFPDDVKIDSLVDLFNFNNHSLVQFFHRNLAYLILFLSLYIGFFILKKNIQGLIKPYIFFITIIFTQIILGILVLYSGVNLYLASLHQISSIILIISCLNLYHQSIRS